MTDIQKSPHQSLKMTSVTIFIKAFLSANDSTAHDLAAKRAKTKNENSINTFLLELLNFIRDENPI